MDFCLLTNTKHWTLNLNLILTLINFKSSTLVLLNLRSDLRSDPQNIPTPLSTGANSNVQGESQGAFSKPTPAHSTCLNSQCYALRWAQQYLPSISQLSCTPHALALSQPDSWHSMPQKPVSATGDQTAKDTALAYCQCTLHWTPMAPPVGGGSIGGWTQTSASGCAWRDPMSEVLATRHSMMGPLTQAWLQGGAPIVRGTQILFMSPHGGPLDHSLSGPSPKTSLPWETKGILPPQHGSYLH